MAKKLVKVVLFLLIVFGAVISVLNVLDAQLQAKELTVSYPVVLYLPDVPDCKGEGTGCVDTTNPNG